MATVRDTLYTSIRVIGGSAAVSQFRMYTKAIDSVRKSVDNLNRAQSAKITAKAQLDSFKDMRAQLLQYIAEYRQYKRISAASTTSPDTQIYFNKLAADKLKQIRQQSQAAAASLQKYRANMNIANSAQAFIGSNNRMIVAVYKFIGSLSAAKLAILGVYAAIVVGLIVALRQVTNQVDETVKKFDKYRAQMEQMFGGKGPGARALQWAKDFSATGKATVDDVVGAFMALSRLNIQPTIAKMETIADVAAMTKKYSMSDVAKAIAFAIQENNWQRMHRTIGINKSQVMRLAPEAFTTGSFQTARVTDQKRAEEAIFKLMQQPHFKGAAGHFAENTIEGQERKLKAMKDLAFSAMEPFYKPVKVESLKLITNVFKLLGDILSPIVAGIYKMYSASLKIINPIIRIAHTLLRITGIAAIWKIGVYGAFFTVAKILEAIAYVLEISAKGWELLAKKVDSFIRKIPGLRIVLKTLEGISDVLSNIPKLPGEEAGYLQGTAVQTAAQVSFVKLATTVKNFEERMDSFEKMGDKVQSFKDSWKGLVKIPSGGLDKLLSEEKIKKYSKVFDAVSIQNYSYSLRGLQNQLLKIKDSVSYKNLVGMKTDDVVTRINDATTKYKDTQDKILDLRLKILDTYSKQYDIDRLHKEIIGGGDLAKLGVSQWEVWSKIGNKLNRTISNPKLNIKVSVDGDKGLQGFVEQIATQVYQEMATWVTQKGNAAFGNTFSWK